MELRIRGERAVLAADDGVDVQEADPHSLAIGTELAEALHEWARVAAALRRAEPAASEDHSAEAAAVVSRRGHQLAVRVATVMGAPLVYRDPVTDLATLIEPPLREPSAAPSLVARLFGTSEHDNEPTPWGTGLTVAAFVAAVLCVAMLALAGTLATETSGWLAVVASLIVTAGLAPSLWLARRLPIVRWAALGAAVGVVIAWVGVLIDVL
ncbi:MAG: hypothetical protein JWQ81_5623 [Amycolatopsis sp.]|uniref:DUF2537 domain-containing protein n=1 Tax=Amycolatopsis sp. TaxID=37632 RepID=UPI00261D0BB8|nr:DUF2537 domain-containing protein [Amycolatopsis sp.]MCU1684884.1 hypothetical protein [Amycolatopsis sp.]